MANIIKLEDANTHMLIEYVINEEDHSLNLNKPFNKQEYIPYEFEIIDVFRKFPDLIKFKTKSSTGLMGVKQCVYLRENGNVIRYDDNEDRKTLVLYGGNGPIPSVDEIYTHSSDFNKFPCADDNITILLPDSIKFCHRIDYYPMYDICKPWMNSKTYFSKGSCCIGNIPEGIINVDIYNPITNPDIIKLPSTVTYVAISLSKGTKIEFAPGIKYDKLTLHFSTINNTPFEFIFSSEEDKKEFMKVTERHINKFGYISLKTKKDN